MWAISAWTMRSHVFSVRLSSFQCSSIFFKSQNSWWHKAELFFLIQIEAPQTAVALTTRVFLYILILCSSIKRLVVSLQTYGRMAKAEQARVKMCVSIAFYAFIWQFDIWSISLCIPNFFRNKSKLKKNSLGQKI